MCQAAFDAIVAHAREASPLECCGLLMGSDARIEQTHRARNLHASPTRFLIDPHDHFAAIHTARASGHDVVGVYHSHPTGPAAPSASDLAEAAYDEYVYAIVSPGTDAAEVRLFRLASGRFVEEPIELLPA